MRRDRLIRVFEWLILVGVVALLAVGVVSWATRPAAQAAQVITPTLPVTQTAEAAPSSDSATATVTPAVPTSGPHTPTPTNASVPTTVAPTWTLTPVPTPTTTPTSTPTPQPVPSDTPTPGPISLPNRVPLPELASTPVLATGLAQPEPMPIVSQPDGTVNILLLGMDREAGQGIARTDVILVASVFPGVPAVSLLSIPRDYYAWIPGWGLDKINTAYTRASRVGYPGGAAALAKATVEYNLGVPIHFYAMVDFTSYRTIVDAVGGIDLIVECPLHDTYPDPESPTGQTDIDLEPGQHHLDGKFALWYVRSRWNTSDFDRHRRQQQVLRAIFQRARSAEMLARVPELWSAYRESVETDLGLKELITLASVAARLDERDVHSTFIRGSDVINAWTAPNGAYVLVPNPEAVQTLVAGAMQPLATSRASQRSHRVVVSNGSWSRDFGLVAAYRLQLEGLEVTAIEDVDPEPRTRLVDFTTTMKGSPLWRLTSLYRLQPGDVTAEPTEGSQVDFQVILGANYNPCTGTGTARWRPTPVPVGP